MKFPPALRPGDTVAVVAPSSPFDRAAALEGIAWLRERYRVLYEKSLFAREGYLAGSDRRRLAELQRAFDGKARAVVAARGGYGLSRIAHLLRWEALRRHPKWIVGFSDLTVLHVEAWRRGVGSVHGAMVCSLGKTPALRDQWLETLENPTRERAWTDLEAWRGGRATGTLVGGNLAMLHACAAAGRLRIPASAVVFVEDIGERPYRVDRMLSNLITSGHFARASAIVVGSFTECGPGSDGRTVGDVLRDRLSTLKVPIVATFPAGHGEHNDAVILGRRCDVDARARTVRIR